MAQEVPMKIKQEPLDPEIDFTDDVKVELKTESGDVGEVAEPEPVTISIKVEPLGYASDSDNKAYEHESSDYSNDGEPLKNETKPDLHESSDCSNDDEPLCMLKSANTPKQKSKINSDDEYIPPKKSYIKKARTRRPKYALPKAGEVKQALVRKRRNQTSSAEQTYSKEVISNVQIVIISEEDREKEYRENLNNRTHLKYNCVTCALGFVVKEAYLMHMKVHSEESGPHKCNICGYRLMTAKILYKHKLRHYRRYRCKICLNMFRDRDSAASHVMIQHERVKFTCEYCGQAFKRPKYLKSHVSQKHTKPKEFECPVCQKVFYERTWFRCHVRQHNEEVRPIYNGSLQCKVCNKDFKSLPCLKRHLLVHESKASCPLCQEGCRNQEALGRHLRQAHGANVESTSEHVCPHCSRVLTTSRMLSRHVRRMHIARTKDYQCDHCQRYYYTKAEVRSHIMWSHMRACGGHACACGRVFRTPSLLRDHQARAHAGLVPAKTHACDHCGKAFSNKQLLNRHMKSHSDETYPCDECGLTFKTKGYVKIHHKLKHLNMTRAEIKAQSRRPEPLTVEAGMKLTRKNVAYLERDPLAITVVNIKEERESDLQVPLFETFVDLQ